MIKDTNKRKQFVRELINNPKAAAERLEMFAVSLKHSRNSDERIKIACELLFLSDQTILNDYLT